jgi:hypothetical protein
LRFPGVAAVFLVLSAGFFAIYAVGSYFLGQVQDALVPTAPADSLEMINFLPSVFGVIAAIFFVTGIILIFVLDSLRDDPEFYYRR